MSEEQTSKRPRRRVWSIIVVALIVLVLGGMLLPIIGTRTQSSHRHMKCGRNQTQILGSLVAFTTMEDMQGWVPSDLPVDPRAVGANRGRLVTTKLFERVAAAQLLPGSLFKCDSSATSGPAKDVKPKLSDPASEWGLGAGNLISYAFDWAAPLDPAADRPMLADRDPQAHQGVVNVVFGDGHRVRVKLIPQATRALGSLVTDDTAGKPMSVSTGAAPDDDIYSNDGDGGDPLTPGMGDPKRAWVK